MKYKKLAGALFLSLAAAFAVNSQRGKNDAVPENLQVQASADRGQVMKYGEDYFKVDSRVMGEGASLTRRVPGVASAPKEVSFVILEKLKEKPGNEIPVIDVTNGENKERFERALTAYNAKPNFPATSGTPDPHAGHKHSRGPAGMFERFFEPKP